MHWLSSGSEDLGDPSCVTRDADTGEGALALRERLKGARGFLT
jgi:hypothetical protein